MIAKAVTGTATGGTGLQNLSGWFISENDGTPAAATVNLRAGGAAETVIYQVEIAASGDDDRSLLHPVDAKETNPAGDGLWYVEVAAGTARWTVEGR